MPTHQDRYEVSLELVTIAGTEYATQADLSHYEDVAELEDDILCFLPTVSDLDVFGCELELLSSHTQQPLPFFPRVRTPCGHGAQVIVEGREEQSDGGEKNKETQHNPNQTTQSPQAESPPSRSLSSVLGETGETKTNV